MPAAAVRYAYGLRERCTNAIAKIVPLFFVLFQKLHYLGREPYKPLACLVLWRINVYSRSGTVINGLVYFNLIKGKIYIRSLQTQQLPAPCASCYGKEYEHLYFHRFAFGGCEKRADSLRLQIAGDGFFNLWQTYPLRRI